MKDKIDIYIITTDYLKFRFGHLKEQISKLKVILDMCNYDYSFHQINNPTHKNIEQEIDKYKEKVELKQEDINDNDFKNLIEPLNSNQISNIMKHVKALELIKKSNTKYNLIIEDDILIVDDFTNNLKNLMKDIKNINYDLVFTCLGMNEENKENRFIKSFQHFKFLMSKSSYLISPKCAEKLLVFLDKIRFVYKINLSYFIWENRYTIESYVYNKNTILEGSKLGLFTSSLNNNNYLYQNNEYIKLSQIVGNKDYIEDDEVKRAEVIYNNSGRNNPDFQHSLGLIYYKNKNYKKAKEILIEAILNMKKTDGLVSRNSEMLNNCVNMHQFEQSDIEQALKLDGIYC